MHHSVMQDISWAIKASKHVNSISSSFSVDEID